MALTAKAEGTTTTQVLSQGRMGALGADANQQGHIRGYARVPDLKFPLSASERESGRVSLGAGVLPGKLSVVRRGPKNEYVQSAVDLSDGEIDRDLEFFLERSDQIPTVLAAEVLMQGDVVQLAAGVLVQAMPDGDRTRLAEIRAAVAGGGLAQMLQEISDPQALLTHIQPDSEIVEAPVIMQFKCRCSQARVVRSFQMLSATELAEMIEAAEPSEVTCDFCATKYSVSVSEMQDVFELLAKAKA